MERLTDCIVPALIFLVCLCALGRHLDCYSLFVQGAARGLDLIFHILPALVGLLAAVEVFQASGAALLLENALAPFFERLGIPRECAPLVLVRPLSGSAALAVGADIMARFGADSLVGRTAAIMLGSTETTFYTVCVYFGASGIRKTRYAIPAALIADLVGFTMAALTARIL